MKALKWISHILAINIIFLGLLKSQSPITFSAQLGVEDGLVDRVISKIDRDENGYFWLLKDNFIQSYDGKNFGYPIDHPAQNSKYFKSLDNERLLLISQENETYIINKNENSYSKIKIPERINTETKLIDVHYAQNTLLYIFEHHEYFVTYECDLNSGDYPFKLIFSAKTPLPINVKTIYFHENIFLLNDHSDQFYLLDSAHIHKIDLGTSLREQPKFSYFQKISENELYFSLPRVRGAFLYKNDSIKVIDNFSSFSFVKKDNQGNVLMGLTNRDRFTEQVLLLGPNGKKNTWYELMNIEDTFTDVHSENFNDQLLLGSYTGLFYVKMQNQGIKKTHLSPKPIGEFGNVIMSFCSNPEGDVFYNKEAGGVFKFTGTDPQIIAEEFEVVYNLHSIYHVNQIWSGGYTADGAGILYSINDKTKAVKSFDIDLPVFYIFPISEDFLLLLSSSSTSTEILYFDINKQMVTDTFLSLKGERARKIEQLDDSTFLIGTTKRLFTFNPITGENIDILQETDIRTFFRDNDYFLVGSIGKGLFVFDKSLILKKIIDKNSGLGNNYIYCIEKDDLGFYWLGTNYGLNVIDSSFVPFRDFNMNDGTSNFEFNSQSVLKLPNGNILFGTINGVTEINPTLALSPPISERAIIPSIEYKINNVLISQAIANGQVQLRSSAKDLNLNIKVNDYYISNSTGRVPRYNINVSPSNSEVIVTNNAILFPRIKDRKALVCIQPKSFDSILPSNTVIINRTYNLRFLYVGLLLFFSFSAVSLIVSRKIIARNRHRENEKKESQIKMAELELQALRSQMNPHFIFNSLGAILHYIQTNDKKKAEKYLTKFAKLMRSFLESSKSKFISFEEEAELLELYLQLEKLRFEDKFRYTFNIDDRIDMHNFVLPSMLLQPFVENAINHGLYHKKGNQGLLNITAITDNDTVKVIIEDNGIGREAARIIREKSLKKHKSRAGEIIQERINVLKQQKNINIDFKYDDLFDKNGQPAGTRVTISIPKIIKEL